MSYDFHLYPRSEADTFRTEVEALSADDSEINPGAMSPEREAWKAKIRDALMMAEPAFQPFAFGFREIADMYDISEAEARIRYRHIELNLPDEDRSGIQVTLYDALVTVTVPYWHTGAVAAEVLERIWKYLRVLESTGELITYDPQIDRILELSTDYDEVLNRYLRIATRLPEIVEQARPAKKPWWKFW